jgi:hypothetical protein
MDPAIYGLLPLSHLSLSMGMTGLGAGNKDVDLVRFVRMWFFQMMRDLGQPNAVNLTREKVVGIGDC